MRPKVKCFFEAEHVEEVCVCVSRLMGEEVGGYIPIVLIGAILQLDNVKGSCSFYKLDVRLLPVDLLPTLK